MYLTPFYSLYLFLPSNHEFHCLLVMMKCLNYSSRGIDDGDDDVSDITPGGK